MHAADRPGATLSVRTSSDPSADAILPRNTPHMSVDADMLPVEGREDAPASLATGSSSAGGAGGAGGAASAAGGEAGKAGEGKTGVVAVGVDGPATGSVESSSPSTGGARSSTRPEWREKCAALADHKWFSLLMAVMTVYALFGDDLRRALFFKPADPVFYGISSVALFLFALELALNSLGKPRFLWSFFFWLDLLATVSLVADIGWIINLEEESSEAQDGSAALRTGKATRAGSRAGRIVRIVRLVRLVRLVKLYKHVKGEDDDEEEEVEAAHEPSKVGKRLSERTTRGLIILVLTMLFVLPFISPTALDTPTNEYQSEGLATLHRMPQDGNVTEDALRFAVQHYVAGGGVLLYLRLCPTGCARSPAPADVSDWIGDVRFRDSEGTVVEANPLNGWSVESLQSEEFVETNYRSPERSKLTVTGCFVDGELVEGGTCESEAVFDDRALTTQEAWYSVIRTWVVMFALMAGSFWFTHDAEKLVIGPIERMVKTVQELAENPLKKCIVKGDPVAAGEDGYETALLEDTIAKIGGLLQVGFGEAGAEIIGKNMGGAGEMDPLIAGSKVFAVFGFCNVLYFLDTTECLQEEIMVYVNRIAALVHSAVHGFGGAANKNIGDAFLLAWKLPGITPEGVDSAATGGAGGRERRESAVSDYMRRQPGIISIADSALCAFVKTIMDVQESSTVGELSRYATHPEIRKRFTSGFSVKMGFGLNIGWAIEGAIGSRYKIDASYLSPHVNVSARLETACKQYGVRLLFSSTLFSLLSPELQALCRKIDRVTVKGSIVPIDLYTFDIAEGAPSSAETFPEPEEGGHYAVDFARLAALQRNLAGGFKHSFQIGVEAYLSGDWKKAERHLVSASSLVPGDGPSQTLLRYMAEFDFIAPRGWEGYRALSSK
eukprot:PLAT2913.1.p2 GENE.PLAT2913.1~~PLAT2913.1.p2  ORF type:complete len:895 (+),score=492.34 PLAT2913.1:104-2788(+)